MPDPVAVSPAERDPRWFLLLMACRWPLALVLAAWALALAVVQVLRQPIPIGLPLAQPLPVRLEGGIRVDRLVAPVVVRADAPLPVGGQVELTRPIAVRAAQPLPVTASAPLPVEGSVTVDQISQPLTVGSITDDVQVSTEEPLLVNGAVSVEQVGGQITVMLKNALQSISPIPLP